MTTATRGLWLTTGAVCALALATASAQAQPKTSMLHQWSEGSDAAAIAKLGEKMHEAAGGIWEQTSIAGHTANTLAKLRSDVVAHNMTVLQKCRGSMMEVITEFVNTSDMSAEDAANMMADSVEAQM